MLEIGPGNACHKMAEFVQECTFKARVTTEMLILASSNPDIRVFVCNNWSTSVAYLSVVCLDA